MVTDTSSRIFLAYDGSINGDWISRYAIHIAANTDNGKLFLLHILDGSYTPEEICLKIKAIEAECAFHHVELGHALVPLKKNVWQTILESIPHESRNFCICGSRVSSRGRGFLTGTISEKLLQAKQFNVLAIRVVQPGLLGCPQDLLIPLVGTSVRYAPALPFYQLLANNIRKVHFLRVVHVNQLLQRYMSRTFLRSKRNKGLEFLAKMLTEIKEQYQTEVRFDGRVIVSSDWVGETLVQASRLRAQLLLLEADDHKTFPNLFQLRKIERVLHNTTCDVALFTTV